MNFQDRYSDWKTGHPILWWTAAISAGLCLLFATGGLAFLVLALASAPAQSGVGSFVGWLLALNTTQYTWFITRAAGLTTYLLLWLSMVWGLAVASRILEGKLHGSFTYDFHQFISLLAIGFVIVHVVVLLFDQYLTFSVPQILIPFISTYRPLWVGVGILSLYLTLLVTVTFYLRDRIGRKAFSQIHVLSLLAFVAAAAHGLYAGTDSPLPAVQLMYAGTFLSIVFLTVYWFVLLRMKKRQTTSPEKVVRLKPVQITQPNRVR